MTKQRVCVTWFEGGEPKERGFRVNDDAWHARVRVAELMAVKRGDPSEDVSVYSTSLDGQDTEGFWLWSEQKSEYEYHELG